MQGIDKSVIIGPIELQAKNAKTEVARKHAEQYAATLGNIFGVANATVLALPNRPLDPAKLPIHLDLGGLTAAVETYPGHSGTDLIVRVPEQNVVYTGDLLFNNMRMVRQWGVRHVDIQILEWGSKAMSLKLLEGRQRRDHVRQMVAALRKQGIRTLASNNSPG